MPGCAFGPCGRRDSVFPGPGMVFVKDRWHCYLCYILPKLFPPIEPCNKRLADGQRCRFVKGHAIGGVATPCKPDSGPAPSPTNATRDGSPKLAAERERKHPMFVKRQRAGPMWVPRDRRV